MELVKISLNVDIQSMFFLPGKLHLTYENPGPVELDPSSLTDEEKSWINQAYATNVLFVDNPNKKEELKKKAEVAETLARTPIEMPEVMTEKKAEVLEQVKALLSSKVSAIKSSIKTSDDILLLRIMKEVETDGKNRKSVKASLSDRITEIQSKVIEALGGDQGEIGVHVTDASLRNLPEVEEVAEKTIQIKPLDKKDK